ncbi:Type 1 glutamine amidotransferase-like domain-containing protein [Streptomyces sp. NPDC001435]|uniref:Type 1 glutamine amidotransferase-like domain-containing protein n=1 Tax=unclassified Streptomyces TaxID=2593676 RepID=UPI0036817E97
MGSRTFLIGGGWDTAEVYEPFLDAAGDAPRIGCVVLDEGDGSEQFARYEGALRKAGDCTPVPLLVPLGGRFGPEAVAGVDGVLVCGGLTPAYQEAFAQCLEGLLRALAERGVPYAGFSAGAAVAARHAVVGGWLLDGVPVCPENSAEDLEEIAVRPGLGLVPFGVDVHAAQWGTLPRLVAAVARGYVPYGVALDENTLVEVGDDGYARVSGLGRAHVVRPADDSGDSYDSDGQDVLVRSYGDGGTFPVR